jgi:hypothetical protein
MVLLLVLLLVLLVLLVLLLRRCCCAIYLSSYHALAPALASSLARLLLQMRSALSACRYCTALLPHTRLSRGQRASCPPPPIPSCCARAQE